MDKDHPQTAPLGLEELTLKEILGPLFRLLHQFLKPFGRQRFEQFKHLLRTSPQDGLSVFKETV